MIISCEGVPATAKVKQVLWTLPMEFLVLHGRLKAYHFPTKGPLTCGGGDRDPESKRRMGSESLKEL